MSELSPWPQSGLFFRTRPFVAWRVWRLSPGIRTLSEILGSPLPWQLRSPVVGVTGPVWLLRKRAEARHQGCAQPPEPRCGCGLYAFNSPAHFMRTGQAAAVVGEVWGWGRVMKHEFGWRFEYAYPRSIFLTCERCLRRPAEILFLHEFQSYCMNGRWVGKICPYGDADDAAVHAWCELDVNRDAHGDGILISAAGVESQLLRSYGVQRAPWPPAVPDLLGCDCIDPGPGLGERVS